MSYFPRNLGFQSGASFATVCALSILISTAVWSKNLRLDLAGFSVAFYAVFAVIALLYFAINLKLVTTTVNFIFSKSLTYFLFTSLFLCFCYVFDNHPAPLQKFIKYVAYFVLASQLAQLKQHDLYKTFQFASYLCLLAFIFTVSTQLEQIPNNVVVDGQTQYGLVSRFHLGSNLPNGTAQTILCSMVLFFLSFGSARPTPLRLGIAFVALSAFFIFIIYTQSRSVLLMSLGLFAVVAAFQKLHRLVGGVLLSSFMYFVIFDPKHIWYGLGTRLSQLFEDGFGGRLNAICLHLKINSQFCSVENPWFQPEIAPNVSSHNAFVSGIALAIDKVELDKFGPLPSMLSYFPIMMLTAYFIFWGYLCFKEKNTCGSIVWLILFGSSQVINIWTLHSVMILACILPALFRSPLNVDSKG